MIGYCVVVGLTLAGFCVYQIISNRHVCPKCRAKEQVDTCWCCGEVMPKN